MNNNKKKKEEAADITFHNQRSKLNSVKIAQARMKESLGRDKALHENFAGKTEVVNNRETQRNFRCLTNASLKLSMEFLRKWVLKT